MSDGFSSPVVGGGGALIRPSAHSPGYVHGTTGWSINKDGSAEFNNIVIRGGTVVSGTALYYSGTPALGNLVLSISPAAGIDPYGNAYPAGIAAGMPGGPQMLLSTSAGAASLQMPTSNVDEQNASEIFAQAFSGSTGNSLLQISGPTATAKTDLVKLELNSSTYDGVTDPATFVLAYVTAAGVTQPILTAWNTGATFTPTAIANPGLIIDGLAGQTGNLVILQTNGTDVMHVNPAGQLLMTGALIKALGGVAYVNQSPSLATNWATMDSGGAFGGFQYRLDGEDNFKCIGAIHMTLAAGIAAGTYQFATATGVYLPKKSWRIGTAEHTSSANVWKTQAAITLTSAGAIELTTSTAIAQNDNFYLYGDFPLGNIA